ncbi:MAG TPA: nitroreductase [Firmicutes bacterium]|nr:nitroreductase [Bacillota bacterium]
MKSIIQTIRERSSWRTYDESRPVEAELREEIMKFIKSNKKTIFGTNVRFELIDTTEAQRDELKKLGTYGIIRGASLFLAGTAEKKENSLVDFGYAMEKNILFISDKGLGTCWMGVTFNRNGYSEKMKIKDDEFVAAVSPVGHHKKIRRLKDNAVRWAAKSWKRKNFEDLFFDGDFGKKLERDNADPYRYCLESVRIAPSASNKQPWRIVKDGLNAHLYLEKTHGYKFSDGQKIDMGIAMCHFELVAREQGLPGEWKAGNPEIESGGREYISTWKSGI